MFCVPHQPRPVDDLVQLQSDEDELQNIYWTQHLQLRRGRQGETIRTEVQDCTLIKLPILLHASYIWTLSVGFKAMQKMQQKQPVLLETKSYAGIGRTYKRFTAGQDLHTSRTPSTHRKHYPEDHFLLFHTRCLKKCNFAWVESDNARTVCRRLQTRIRL